MMMRSAVAAQDRNDREWEDGQRALADRLATWRAGTAPVHAAMEQFGAGAALEQCAPVADLFGAGSPHGMEFAQGFVADCLAGLTAHPLGQLPLLHGTRDSAPAVVLASSGRASLALAAYDGARLKNVPAPRTVRFAPQETWIHVLAGSGTADHVLCRDGPEDRMVLQSARIALEPGMVLYRYGPRETLQVRGVAGNLVLLRLQRRLAETAPVREYSLPDGTLLHQAMARAEDTRTELAMALLARMGRKDAVSPMKRIAGGEPGQDAPDSLRWQALREVLALDTDAGLDLLDLLMSRPHDPLSGPAAALRGSLYEIWPELEPEGGRASWPE